MKQIDNYLLPRLTEDLFTNEAKSSIALSKEVANKVNELVDSYNELIKTRYDKMNEQDGRIRQGILYMKDNLANTINDLLKIMKDNGELESIINDSLLNEYNNIKNSLEVRVEDFGAVGDGTTDDSIPIQLAINYASLNNKIVVLKNNKTYLVNKEWIVLKENTKINLNGSTIESKNKHLFANFDSDSKSVNYNGNGNIEIYNGTIKHGSLAFIQSHDVNIHDINFIDCDNDHWIEISACKNFIVKDCRFKGMKSSTRNYVEYIQIDDNTYNAFPWLKEDSYSYQNLPNININIDSCSFLKGSGDYNNLYVAIGSHTEKSNVKHSNIIINNNFIENTIYNIGIRLINANNSFITNNKLKIDDSQKYAIQLKECEYISVSNNAISSDIGRLINIVNSYYLKITNNSSNRFTQNRGMISLDYEDNTKNVFIKCDEYFPLINSNETLSETITFNKDITLFNEMIIETGSISQGTYNTQEIHSFIGQYFRIGDKYKIIKSDGSIGTISISENNLANWNSDEPYRMIYGRVI